MNKNGRECWSPRRSLTGTVFFSSDHHFGSMVPPRGGTVGGIDLRVIGVDPGTALCGYGVVDMEGNRLRVVDYGVISTHKDTPPAERLLQVHEGVARLMDQHRPEVLAVEELFMGRNVTTAISVGQARGVVLLAGAQRGLELAEYTPGQVKQAVAGYGKAEKAQVQQMVKVLLNLSEVPRPDDVADALAVACCCLQSIEVERRLRRLEEAGRPAVPRRLKEASGGRKI